MSQERLRDMTLALFTLPGIDLNKADGRGVTPLMLAVQCTNGVYFPICEAIFRNADDACRQQCCSAVDKDGKTPLMHAVRNGPAVKLLLAKGADNERKPRPSSHRKWPRLSTPTRCPTWQVRPSYRETRQA